MTTYDHCGPAVVVSCIADLTDTHQGARKPKIVRI